jgi:MFS transporter, ACS family, hexuronate transporter
MRHNNSEDNSERLPNFNASHGKQWQWWVSGLLLMATMINYMDRQTLSNLATRITEQFKLTQEQYGNMEFAFGTSFAFGSLFFGFLADRVSVRWLYPAVLVAWSAIGFITGYADGYQSLLVCRGLLGFFESGHWPCALIVTQRLLSQGDRGLGNSILQSGASLGAISTPIIIRMIVGDSKEPDVWRSPFWIIGAVGVAWAVVWLFTMRKGDLPVQKPMRVPGAVQNPFAWLVVILTDRRFWALCAMVISINASWQLIRAWLPKFLQEGRGYTEATALYFNSLYYIATDVGCLLAGFATLWLARRMGEHRSRVVVFAGCSLLAGLTTVAAMLPAGWPLLGILLFVAGGSLGVFPCYYSFTQEVSTEHMGKLTGMLSFVGWIASSPMQKLFGIIVDRTHSFDAGMTVVGWAPFVGLLVFLALWPSVPRRSADAMNLRA